MQRRSYRKIRGGRQKKRWNDNIKEWIGMNFASSTRAAKTGQGGKGFVAVSAGVPRRPTII